MTDPGTPASGPASFRPPGAVRAPEIPPGLPWFNTPAPLRLGDLRGRFVLLDFWTTGCINCLHVLPDLHRLEAAHGDALVVVGVHAPKFAAERTDETVAEAVRRYGVRHAVVSDADLALWSAYAIRAWPTLVLVDPDGYIVAQRSGEGAFAPFDRVLREAVPRYRAAGRLHPAPAPTTNGEPADDESADDESADDESADDESADDGPAPVAGTVGLRYPAGLAADPARGRLFVADTGHHRLLVADAAGRVTRVVGTGAPGLADGPADAARFRDPRGLAYDPATDTLYVADTGNHAVRRVDLATGAVATVAGTGRQAPWGAATTDETHGALSSPWDVLAHGGRLWVAMAGVHQLWMLDPATGRGAAWAGNAYEHLVDGPRRDAQLAQPSALATDGTTLFFLDAESSALRSVPLDGGPDAPVETLVGEGLFTWGDVDGRRPRARLQHPLGLAWGDGRLVLADTYNHRLKRYDPDARAVVTVAGDGRRGRRDGGPHAARFDEPGALAWDGARVLVADTNNHRLAALDPATGAVVTVALAPAPPEPAALPARAVAPGAATLTLRLVLPAGAVLNADHPGHLRLTAPGGGQEAVAGMPVRFSLVLHADAVVRLDGAVYYCDAVGGVCRVAPVALRVPLHVRAGAADDVEVVIPVPPEHG